MIRRLGLSLIFASLLIGCSSMAPEDFAGKEPRLVLEEFFSGKTRAWGVFFDRSGTLKRQFTVDILGEWDGRTLTLTEDFLFADGEVDQRVWRIEKIDDHNYEGRADDVVGVAKGVAYGNALNWAYTLDLEVDDSTIETQFDDWFFLQPDQVLVNRAVLTKFGITLGELYIVFNRVPAAS